MYAALISLLISGFLSATLLPGTSEAGLVLFLYYFPDSWFIVLILLTIANTLGSMTSFFMTYFIPKKSFSDKVEKLVKKYGTPLLFFSFLPIVGDALPLAAGWLKLSKLKVSIFIAAGKFFRYAVIIIVFFKVNITKV
ncbi:MAG: DedA family protein [Endomicrobia bacterium]|nr:DedA family protein [Endomicrobiia bacterium]